MNDGSLTAHEYPLKKIFCSDYEFHIPEYQRPYRWSTDQAVQLLDDLEDALQRNTDPNSPGQGKREPYFLGSLVLVDRGSPASTLSTDSSASQH